MTFKKNATEIQKFTDYITVSFLQYNHVTLKTKDVSKDD